MFWVLFVLPCSVLANTESTIEPAALQQTTGLFFQGLLIGLQVNPDSPSSCYKSFSTVDTSYEALISILTSMQITKIYPLISAFNNYVNQFVSSFDICNYNGFLNMYFSDLETTILNLLINITGNWDKFNEALSNLVIVIMYGGDPYGEGMYFGKTFRYMTGFAL